MLSTKTKVTLATAIQKPIVAMRRAFGLPSTLQTRRGGARWQLDLCEGFDFSIWLLGAFEPRTIRAYRRIVQPDFTVLDIGANVGAHTLPLAICVGDRGVVYAFEPVRWAVEKLTANLDLNLTLRQRVRVHHAFVGDSPDELIPETLYASWPLGVEDGVHPKLRARPLPTDGAKAIAIDDFVSAEALSRVDFLKIDVDGGECGVLRGAHNTLRRFRPSMVIELQPYALAELGESIDTLLDLLDAAGYDLVDIGSRAKLTPSPREVCQRIPHDGGVNVLAVPRRT